MEIETLLNKIKFLESENTELKEKLKKYTAPSRSKNYYENKKKCKILQRTNKLYLHSFT